MDFKTSRERWIWIAGLVDADGSIYIERNTKNNLSFQFKLSINISNTDLKLLKTAARTIGLGKARHSKGYSANRKSQYKWEVCGPKALHVIQKIRPWLVAKQRQARLAERFQATASTTPLGVRGYPIKAKRKREQFYIDMKALNKKGGAA